MEVSQRWRLSAPPLPSHCPPPLLCIFAISPHFNIAALTRRGPSFHPGVDPSIFINYESTAESGNESWLITMGHGGDCLGPQMNGSEHCDPRDNDWLMR